MIGNALVKRYMISALRPRYLWVNVGMYVIGLALIGVFNSLALVYGTVYRSDTELYLRSVYGQLLAVQVLLLWVWGGYSAGSTLREEMLQKSYDFFRLLPLSPWQKLVGVVVGRNLLALTLAVITAVAQFLVGLAGGVSVCLQIQFAFVMIATTALVWCVSALSSIRQHKQQPQHSPWALLIFFLALGAIPVIFRAGLTNSSITTLGEWEVSFFGIDMPGMLLSGAIAAYFAIWAACGAMRRLRRSELTMFSPAGAYCFLIGCLIVVFGLFFDHLCRDDSRIWLTYAVVTHLLVVAIPFGLMRTYEQYMELTYDLGRRHGGAKLLGRRFLAATNPVIWFGLYVLWSAFVVGAAAVNSMDMIQWALKLVVCLFFAWTVFMLLAELVVVGAPRNEKLKFFAGFLAIIYLVVPMLLAGVLGEDFFWSFSYFGIWSTIQRHVFGGDADKMTLLQPLLLNILIAAVLALNIWRRYRDIVAARRSMLSRNTPTLPPEQ